MLISAEIDAVSENNELIELKTSYEKSWYNTKKQRSIWIQSYIAGIKTIITGFKNITLMIFV